MAASPRFKVYSSVGEYLGSLKYAEDALILIAVLGSGATVRYGHSIKDVLWREGYEECDASESYDRAAQVIRNRMKG